MYNQQVDEMTREQAREQVARALYADNYVAARGADAITRRAAGHWFDDLDKWTAGKYRDQADAALSVLWPEVERLRAERGRGAGKRH